MILTELKNQKKTNQNIQPLFIIVIAIFGIFCDGFLCTLPILSHNERILSTIIGLIFIFLIAPGCRNLKSTNFVLFVLIVLMYGFVFSGIVIYRPGMRSGFRFILLLLALLMLGNLSGWHSTYMIMMYIFGMFYILTTIWLKFDSDSFFRFFAYSMYPDSAVNFNAVYIKGIHPGVTNHYSHNGIMLGNALVVTTAFFLTATKKRMHIIAIILNLTAMVICGKRAQVLFPIIAFILTYLIYSEKNTKTIFTAIAVIIILVIVFLILINTNTIFQNYIARYEDVGEDGSVLNRYSYWRIAIERFRQKPIFGNGWLSFRGFNQYGMDAHNNYIQLLCDVGVVGTIVFLSFFIYNIITAYKSLNYVVKSKNTLQRVELICCIFSFEFQVYFLLYALTGNPIQLMYTCCPYIAACAMGVYYKNKYKSNYKFGSKAEA